MAVLDKNPRLRQKYSRLEQGSDCLYKPDVVHPRGSEHGCDQLCEIQMADLVPRRERKKDEDNLTIHYGVIASAN
jgi:hypothetical protein